MGESALRKRGAAPLAACIVLLVVGCGGLDPTKVAQSYEKRHQWLGVSDPSDRAYVGYCDKTSADHHGNVGYVCDVSYGGGTMEHSEGFVFHKIRGHWEVNPRGLQSGSRRGSTRLAPHQRVKVDDNGGVATIGPLILGVSTRSDVTGFVGKPAAETRGRYANYAPFDALGYGCPGPIATTPAGLPECKTVYYIVRRTRRLALLVTRDPRYSYHRVDVGTAYAVAARRAPNVIPGRGVPGSRAPCISATAFNTGIGWVPSSAYAGFLSHGSKTPGFPGGTPARRGDLRTSYVGFLAVRPGVLPARRNNPGVLDCIAR